MYRRAASLTIVIGMLGAALSQTSHAAAMVVNGATFDAPSNCQAIDDALVCRDDAQQFELSVHRQTIASRVEASAPFVRKMAYVQTLHDAVVKNIMAQTGSESASDFSTYGPYSVIGSAMAGRAA
jgi:gamma-glutamyl phosphate reductase